MQTDGVVLALNSGSSSLKVGCYTQRDGTEQLLLTGSADGIGTETGSLHLRSAEGEVLLAQEHLSESQDEALDRLVEALRRYLPSVPIAVGHRVVHGGPKLREHQRITPEVIATLRAAVHLAPLHIPEALRLIGKARALFGDTPQFACFDTTFHRHMPAAATHLPLPSRYYESGVQRYGFHGLSCESVMRRLAQKLPERLVIAHLGNGSSITAVLHGRSVDTTMGLSPTGGVPMGTRSGDLDPAVVLYLLRDGAFSVDAAETFLNHECGLAGLSDGEADMQRLLSRAAQGDEAAVLARDAFCIDARKAIGSYAALLGGLDQVVFTGGIGEHSEEVRQRIMEGLDFLFTPAARDPRLLVLQAQEEAEIAAHCRELLAASGA